MIRNRPARPSFPLLLTATTVLTLLARPVGAAGEDTAPATLKGQNYLTLPGGDWKLVFSDEFNGSTLDANKWSIGLPWRGDDGTNRHHNSQYASVIADEDIQIKDGALHLTTRAVETPHPKGGAYHYTEGLITTSGKFEGRYGYYVMRAKLPTDAGPGTWPAFWLLTKGWPPEMDILEYWGSDNRIHQGTVTRKSDGGQRWDSYHRHQVSLAGWHTFGLEWGPGYQRYDIDGQVTNTIYGSHLPDGPFYILLNSGIEQARPPRPGTTFPNDFVVDWVRVYERPEVPGLVDGGFEDAEMRPWERQGEAAIVTTGPHGGTRCLRVDSEAGASAPAAARQTIYGLKPGTRYTLTAFIRTTGDSGARLSVGDSTAATPIRSDEKRSGKWTSLTLDFTTGPTVTSAVIACEANGPGSVFFDDLRIEIAK